ncbi:MAG: hypothetical protein MUO54_17145, partial [Anaerolineales bacterium]|nr:hypothetical protein [Anaerolineales bacterium]
MKPESKKYTAVVHDKEIIIETGTLAGLAGGAVTVPVAGGMGRCPAASFRFPCQARRCPPASAASPLVAPGRVGSTAAT